MHQDGHEHTQKKNHSLHDATRNGPVLSPRTRQKSQKKHPPSLEPPQLGSLRNLLRLLRVRACAVRDPHRHHTRARKNRVDIFMRVSARAKDGRQRRPVQHKNRRRARFGVRIARHSVKVQLRWRAVACWQCTMCVCGELGCCGMDPDHVQQSLVSKTVSQSLI